MAAVEITATMIELRYKTFWRRVGASFLDGLIMAPVAGVSALVYAPGRTGVLPVLWFMISSSAHAVYSVLMHARFGATLGKMAAKIKVIDASERRVISLRQAFLRDIVWIVFTVAAVVIDISAVADGLDPTSRDGSDFSSLVFGFGAGIWLLAELVTMLTNARRRSLHDLIAGTVVVRVGPEGALRTGREAPRTTYGA